MSLVRLEGTARYAHGVRHHDTVYLAGQVPDDVSGDAAAQTRQVLDSIDRLLGEFGTHKGQLLAATIYLREIASLSDVNHVWEAWIERDAKPTRTVVEARMGCPGCRVEITVVAAA